MPRNPHTQLSPCASRRRVGQYHDHYYCTNPGFRTEQRIVTPEICRRCPLSHVEPAGTFIAYPFTTNGLRRYPEVQMVVAHFREDLRWMKNFSGMVATVYNKGNPDGPNPLPNVGREAHTYLHHIVEHYNSLAELTIFLQGNPLDHVPDLFEKICSLDDTVSFRELGNDILVEDQNGYPPQPGLPLGSFFRKLFEVEPPPYVSCRAGACFAVSRDTIRLRPRQFYERALQLVVEDPYGAWAIERLWNRVFVNTTETEGIVTAADDQYFPELQFLVRSLQLTSSHPVCVVDLGLSRVQQAWCMDHGVILWSAPQLFAPARRIYQRHWWQAWIKPFYLDHAPFNTLLWIDADCVVTADVAPLFQLIRDRPLFVRDGTEVVTENDPGLYDYLKLASDVKTRGINLNSGVVGLRKSRDRRILDAWMFASQFLAMRPDLQRYSAWADQGLLLFAVLLERAVPEIRQDLQCNQPVFEQAGLLRQAISENKSVFEILKARFPESQILHFLGPHKLSRQLTLQLEQIFV